MGWQAIVLGDSDDCTRVLSEFLETWRRSEDGRWLLVRHHAENV